MEDFRRELEKNKTDESLREILELVSATIGWITLTEEERKKYDDKVGKALKKVTYESTEEIDFNFEFVQMHTEQEVMKQVQELEREPYGEIYEPKNIFQSAGSKVFYDSTIFEDTAGKRGGTAKRTLVAPTFQEDMAGEINSIVYLEKPKIPDYEITLKMR